MHEIYPPLVCQTWLHVVSLSFFLFMLLTLSFSLSLSSFSLSISLSLCPLDVVILWAQENEPALRSSILPRVLPHSSRSKV